MKPVPDSDADDCNGVDVDEYVMQNVYLYPL